MALCILWSGIFAGGFCSITGGLASIPDSFTSTSDNWGLATTFGLSGTGFGVSGGVLISTRATESDVGSSPVSDGGLISEVSVFETACSKGTVIICAWDDVSISFGEGTEEGDGFLKNIMPDTSTIRMVIKETVPKGKVWVQVQEPLFFFTVDDCPVLFYQFLISLFYFSFFTTLPLLWVTCLVEFILFFMP